MIMHANISEILKTFLRFKIILPYKCVLPFIGLCQEVNLKAYEILHLLGTRLLSSSSSDNSVGLFYLLSSIHRNP